MDRTAAFTLERPRLVGLATRILGDHGEAEDIAQQAWIRLHGTSDEPDNPAAWLTTVTVRLCLDRLKARVPVPEQEVEPAIAPAADPVDDVVLADTVAAALHVVLDRLSPRERVAFVLHDTFGFEFPMIAELLDTSPAAARQLASRARAKVAQPAAEDRLADHAVVDAFLAAARGGELTRLLELLAPDVVVLGDEPAVALGTPERIEGRAEVAAFFDGAAASALPVFVGDRPGAAWFDRGTPRVAFDFAVREGRVTRIEFRAEPGILATLRRRRGAHER
ncbi:sigma-70 family RNA polymerase sigma factor [Nostocoides sp. F2B08]|uniref:sigma-70 family RNA polymerase sigma factor n=1 Tax=Nostocoides sp. F2B08 TaxID=2653936 RepID=UPI001263DEE4|nr:sigma-70 family RNA polymerase sigma factor [Tetrasphaera sp. F2B08]KAB7745415.1 sigma-70 family RNA polymerase sigma factor [Tetrasphaera sp. F2B08]